MKNNVGTISKSNMKNVERGKIDIHNTQTYEQFPCILHELQSVA
jgi:hypothetical protein